MFIRKPRFAKGGFAGEIPKRVSLKIFVLSTGIYLFILSPSRKFMCNIYVIRFWLVIGTYHKKYEKVDFSDFSVI